MKFYEGLLIGKRNKRLDFGSNLDHNLFPQIFKKDFLPLWDRDKLNICI